MQPVLFRLGSYEVASYGAALTLAFAVGIFVAHRRGVARGLDGERIVGVCMLILVASLLGSRLLWVVTHASRFRPPLGRWSDAFHLFQGADSGGGAGLSMLGGVVLATAVCLVTLARHGQPVWKVADVLAPSVALGEGITRIGCFLNGCCHGVVCTLPWGVRFPEGSAAAALFPGAAVHPTQLYASLLGFASFAFLVWLAGRRLFDGAVVLAFLLYTGVARIGLDFLRYTEEPVVAFRAAGAAITINQLLGLALALVGAAGLAGAAVRAGRSRRATRVDPRAEDRAR